ncbi:MAG: hypothetical protein RBS16_09945 [Candidatus Cloacimonadales bacterium]|jgi:CRISPR-associated protein Csx10|nr:hypothetical protein [Candidatus Cloacimonadota bacterium]MDD2650596.1 hypothetical protein [Candidatus Cloacimonadota bacterium]MDD3501146.1 hypothetical protein [Candidatus Cloacimonadota bacterium]MDX9978335.1 hypothetical protein [Candidatus Cloacimonadales bacterium]
MKKLDIIIKLISPVIISQSSGDSTLTNTLSYIPGSTVLGLLANMHISKNGEEDFDRLFMMGGLRFLNLYPFFDDREYFPCPMNIQYDKKDYDNKKPLLNMLDDNEDDLTLMKKFGSSFFAEKDGIASFYQPKKKLYFHHERDYEEGISKESIIFTYEALEPGQEFSGSIIGEEKDLKIIEELLAKTKTIRIGKSKTAQYGRAELIKVEIVDLVEPEGGTYLLLKSDLILKNKNYASVNGLDAVIEALNDSLANKNEKFSIDKCFMESARNEIAVGILRAKKPVDYTIKAGSVFKLTKTPDNYMNLQKYGIGERRWEGFGDIEFKEFDNKYYRDNEEDRLVERPNTEVPELIKNICKNALYRVQEEHLMQKAYIAAKLFKGNISKSLASRLEGFARSGSFSESFAELRDISKDTLKKCYVNNENLYDYLNDKEKMNLMIDEELASTSELNFSKEKKVADFKKDFGLEDIAYEDAKRIFLTTFFLALRRKAKIEGGRGGKDE